MLKCRQILLKIYVIVAWHVADKVIKVMNLFDGFIIYYKWPLILKTTTFVFCVDISRV